MVDAEKTAMGYLYEAMGRAKEAIIATYGGNQDNHFSL
jgi:hypothetical protein